MSQFDAVFVSTLVPLLAATVVAYAVTILLLRRSTLTEKIARRGQHITRGYGVDPFELSRANTLLFAKAGVCGRQCSPNRFSSSSRCRTNSGALRSRGRGRSISIRRGSPPFSRGRIRIRSAR